MGLRTGSLQIKVAKNRKRFQVWTVAAAALLQQKGAKPKLFCLLFVPGELLLPLLDEFNAVKSSSRNALGFMPGFRLCPHL